MTTIADTMPTQSNLDFSEVSASSNDVGDVAVAATSSAAQTGSLVNISIDGYCPNQSANSSTNAEAGMIDKMFSIFESLMENMFKMFTAIIQTLTQALTKTQQPAQPAQSGTTNTGTTNTGTTGTTGTGTNSSGTTNAGSTSGTTSTTPTTPTKDLLTVSTDTKGLPQVKTDDGYLVTFDGKDQGWTITDPKGIATHIWGDPHVNESDGDKWDFKNNSSFKFGKNKISVETVPAGNGQTYTKALHIYSGDQRVTVGGIDTNQVALVTNAHDAAKHDRSILDGDVYTRSDDKKKGHEGHEAWHRTKKAA